MPNICPVKNFIRPDKPHECTYEEALLKNNLVSECPHTKLIK